ncbi:hypothetical protein MNBD_GAMMA12-2638, partial [hydrothermal vent metagenome]
TPQWGGKRNIKKYTISENSSYQNNNNLTGDIKSPSCCTQLTGEKTMDLVKYEAAIQAIDKIAHIDDAVAGLDKIVAIEVYAKRANNHELERNAVRVRIRAERKCGELLKDREMNKGG